MPPAPTRPPHLLSTLPAPASPGARLGRMAALVLAGAGPITAAATLLYVAGSRVPYALWVPVGSLGLSAVLAHHGRAGSQLVARGVWWANLLLGTLLALVGSTSERTLGLVMVVGTGAPLLAMGRLGLGGDDEASAFRPVAFRTTLSLAMIMAVADAQALVFWGILKLENTWQNGPLPHEAQGAVLLLAAALILIAIVGLYRLRVWGLLLGALSAAGVVALAVSNVCGLDSPFPQVLVATSLVQLALPVPVLAAVVRGRAPSPDPSSRLSRLARLAPAIVVSLLMTVSAWGVLVVRDSLLR